MFNVGDGVDIINDAASPGEGNILSFGPGITPPDLTLGIGSLVIRIGTNGDAIHIQNFDPQDVMGTRGIETVQFADGTSLTYEQLIERGFELTGGTDDDTIIGTNVVDRITGLAGKDLLQSGDGDDVIDGGLDIDTMNGGGGDDVYVVDNGGDLVIEQPNEGIDTVHSSLTYTLGDNVENLRLGGASPIDAAGNALNNVLTGNGASNTLDGQAGADTMIGAAGDDTYLVDDMGDTVTESANEGIETVWSSVTYTLSTNVEHLTLTSIAALNGQGNELDNVLTGNGAANDLDGGVGNDALSGLSGNDMLRGGTGSDHMDGGAGADSMIGGIDSDVYVVDGAGDTVVEALNEGIDTVESSITYTLGANVEHLMLTGTAAINGTGNDLDNILMGNSGHNRLSGGDGNDRLDGGLGTDTMLGGSGDDAYTIDHVGDVIAESFNQGTDIVESEISYSLGSNVENLTLAGTSNINGTGNILNNVLIGNTGANALDGGSGHDTLDGDEGDDTLTGGSGSDIVSGGNGSDALDGGSGDDAMWGGEGSDTLAAGSGSDVLNGGAGTDDLMAGSGDDILTGGLGNDVLNGGSGNDLYRFDRADGQDLIRDSSGAADRLTFGLDVDPLDLVISRQANDLRIAIHGTSDQLMIQDWYTSSVNQMETIQAGNGQELANTKVDQLLQAMAAFTQQSGMTWDQAIDQRPQDVQNVLAANWQ